MALTINHHHYKNTSPNISTYSNCPSHRANDLLVKKTTT